MEITVTIPDYLAEEYPNVSEIIELALINLLFYHNARQKD